MDRSMDSIGTCSLDLEASVDIKDWSDVSSKDTLRSVNLVSPSIEPHLPSYLSLACTVNGYSTTINYDPVRLSKSRDNSPHRYDNLVITPTSSSHSANTIQKNQPTYSIQNNLLSPPNLVPLPNQINQNQTKKMSADTHQQQQQQQPQQKQFYRSTKTMNYKDKENFTSTLFSTTTKDTIDGCYENGHIKTLSFIDNTKRNYTTTTTTTTTINGQNKCISTDIKQFDDVTTKSFIQQRVERLYGPGALAQGFFVSKKQMNCNIETNNDNKILLNNDDNVNLLNSPLNEKIMKQSTSSPTLPVLRHLRPEFRAQLPILNTRKINIDTLKSSTARTTTTTTEASIITSSIQKSITVPTLNNNEEMKINGHSNSKQDIPVLQRNENNDNVIIIKEAISENIDEKKNGHYFLKILKYETERLLKLADICEKELEDPNLSDEIVGKIHSAAGKARLLVSQKMQQFKGLCTNNITQIDDEAFPTTDEDLQGFWDMVMLQVDQVDSLFKEIDLLKQNNWKEIKEKKSNISVNGNNKNKKIVSKRTTTTPSIVNEEARKQRELQRKQLLEIRRKAMKQQNKKNDENVEIFVPTSSS